MTMVQKQQVALFRYAVIAPLETGTSDPSIGNNEFFRRVAQKTFTGPDRKETTVGAGTIEKWHHAYSKGGFNALLPQSHKDEGISRKLTPDLQSDIRFLQFYKLDKVVINLNLTFTLAVHHLAFANPNSVDKP
ncbi:MAG: hypothetical protein LUD12_14940 [Lachnospiraceae bacterium]|nr:hypothetical protein [Lachnospiraceae bacterium]